MLKVSIKNKLSQQITNQARFETQIEIDSWIEQCELIEAFGKPEHQLEILNEEGLSLEPQQFETIPAEYTIEIENIDAQINQEKINAEAQAFLNESDFYVIRFMETGIEMPEGMSEARQNARERIIK